MTLSAGIVSFVYVSEQCISDCGKCFVCLLENMIPANQSSRVHLGRNSAKTFIVYRDELQPISIAEEYLQFNDEQQLPLD